MNVMRMSWCGRLCGAGALAVVLAGVCAFVSLAAQSGRADVVRVEQGSLAGTVGEAPGVRVFKGIPFAAPPVGDLRWRSPAPPVAWRGIRQATTFSKACMQDIRPNSLPWTQEYMPREQVSEDCLYLNVWTAATHASDKRPVLVYIHGGAFREGSGGIDVYDGSSLAARGVVVVTINYRLGIFGFLAHPELAAEGPQSGSGHYAALDAIAALRWIQRNIAAFGGDPSRVTISGQSAGASMVQLLLVIPSAKGLFQGAIVQSGPGGSGPIAGPKADAEQTGLRAQKSLGAANLAALRALPAETVLAARPAPGGPALVFRPSAGGAVVTSDLFGAFAAGQAHDVPALVGFTADEGSSSPTYGKVPAVDYVKQSRDRYRDKADQYLALYPGATDAEASLSQKQAARDRAMVSMVVWAEKRAAAPGAKASTYAYFFTRGIPWPEHPEFGAFHSGELPYVFGALRKLDRPWTDVDRTLEKVSVSYWANFVGTGNPNGSGVPAFPAVTPGVVRVMELGATTGPLPEMSPAKVAFWRDAIVSVPGR